MQDFIFAFGDRVLLALKTFSKWAEIDFWESMFVAGLAIVIVVMYRLHRSEDNVFQVEQFFTEEDTGKASVKKLLGVGAFGITSWILARYAVYTTPLDEKFILMYSTYLFFWAGVLMLGKGVEKMMDAVALAMTKRLS